jgi:hypothetical protein
MSDRRRYRGLVFPVLLGLAALGVRQAGVERQAELVAARGRAVAALAAARAQGAAEWAGPDFSIAEARLRDGYHLERLSRASLWPYRGAGHAVAEFDQVAALANAAARAGATARAGAAALSERTVAEAQQAIDEVSAVTATVYVGADGRVRLQRARLALEEGRLLRARGDYLGAQARAREASATARDLGARAARLAGRYQDPERLQAWREWAAETVAWSLRAGKPVIIVDKEHHLVRLYDRGREVASFPAELGFNWVADKQHAGDGATPEGRYRVTARRGRGQSQYYKALLIDYPNRTDRKEFASAKAQGLIPHLTGAGDLIEIHGEGGKGSDWTKGCVAVSNVAMDRLFALVSVGTPVTIVGTHRPGRLTSVASRAAALSAGAEETARDR